MKFYKILSMSRLEHLKEPLGYNGKEVRGLDDFVSKYQWRVEDIPKDKQKIIIEIPVTQYYQIGVFAKVFKISIAKFIKNTVYKELDLIKNNNVETLKDSRNYKIVKSKNKFSKEKLLFTKLIAFIDENEQNNTNVSNNN